MAGNGAKEHSGDGGPAREAGLVVATDVVKDHEGDLYMADVGAFRVRRIDPEGIITTVAGPGEPGHSGDGGDPLQAQVVPTNLALDRRGDLYVGTDECGAYQVFLDVETRVRKITFLRDPRRWLKGRTGGARRSRRRCSWRWRRTRRTIRWW